MAFTDGLSEAAVQDATDIQQQFSVLNTDTFKSLVEKLIEDFEGIIALTELTDVTAERVFYQLNKSIRRRNHMFRKLATFNKLYATAKGQFGFFKNRDRDIVVRFDIIQKSMNLMQKQYLLEKYNTKEVSYTSFTIGQIQTNITQSLQALKDFKEFFFS